MNSENSKIIIDILKNEYKNVKPELDYKNLFELAIAVVLSAQTTDKQVNKVTPKLFEQYPDFYSLSKAPLKEIENIIKTTGFYRNKAKNIINLSIQVATEYNNQLPKDIGKLMSLPGIGKKTANVILSQGFDIPALAVDTHVSRIARRLGYSTEKDPLKIEKDLTAIIPKKQWTISHLLFIKHGRECCKARSPLCNNCAIFNYCFSEDKTL